MDNKPDTSGYLSTQVYDGKRIITPEELEWFKEVMKDAIEAARNRLRRSETAGNEPQEIEHDAG